MLRPPRSWQMPQDWPSRLWIVRHGQSAGNVARDQAHAAGLQRIELAERDVEVPLSALGGEQARALGDWFAAMPAGERPQVVLASTYLRAQQTAQAVIEAGGVEGEVQLCADERLREREFGLLDRLTRSGIEALYPEQAAMRKSLGKFYHRPPGGESWCDVILRLRSAVESICLHHAGQRVLLVGHQVVVLCLRYLIEGLDEKDILAIDAQADVANCGVTEYRLDPAASGLVLARYNFTAPLQRADTPVTDAPDARVVAQ